MNTMIIKKVNSLKGTVRISGSKNAALPILCTSILTRKKVIISNVPRIKDIKIVVKILRYLNCKVKIRLNKIKIDSKNIEYKSLAIAECSRLRGSYYFIPVLLYLFDKCDITLPGGCEIGLRPIDEHIRVFESLGFKVLYKDNHIWIRRQLNIDDLYIKLSKRSVGASINAIVSALKCKYAVLENLVLEPEGLDLIFFLNKLGFDIVALNNKVVYRGYNGSPLKIKYKIIPDRIEAITFLVMGLLCGDIKVKGAILDHISYPLELLIKAKYNICIKDKYIRARKSRGYCFDIKTDVYPMFPTDMQPIFGVLLAYSKGSSVIHEAIFENRMQIYNDLISMGFDINVIDNKAYIIGSMINKPINFVAKDLRHCAALLILLVKNGGSISNIDFIKRGYSTVFYNISNLGVKFKIK